MCEICNNTKGGVLGNENVVDGVIMCDYCHAEKGKKMEFAIGEIWKTRKGARIEILQTEYPSGDYPIFGKVKSDRTSTLAGHTYTRDGRIIKGMVTDDDLVERVNLESEANMKNIGGSAESQGVVKAAVEVKATTKNPLQDILDAARNAKPKHEGGYGNRMVYLTGEMQIALEAAMKAQKEIEDLREVNNRVRREREVFRAVLEGMGFEFLSEYPMYENAVEHARQVGKEVNRRAQSIRDSLEALLRERKGASQ